MRPSIIESALAEPRPGWIRGFRMAEPIIISYARGLLHEFPGVPEGVTDVIPVDLVVAAIIAVAGEALLDADDPSAPTRPDRVPRGLGGPEPVPLRPAGRAGPGLVHRAPPLRQRRPAHRGARRGRSPAGAGSSASCPGPPRRWTLAERVVGSLPIRGQPGRAGWPRLEEQHLLADRALGYVELYGAYTETEARYRVDRLLALWDRMDADDRRPLLPRPGGHRLGRLRPRRPPARRSSSTPGCARRPGESIKTNRADRARKAILSPDRHLAAFDLENTLIASNVVDSYAWLASRHLAPAERAAFVADLLAEAPRCWPLDRQRPGRLPALLLPPLRGRPGRPGCGTTAGSSSTTCCWPSRSPPDSPGSGQHRALGHRTMLITGALDFVVEPLRPLFDDIVCARLG